MNRIILTVVFFAFCLTSISSVSNAADFYSNLRRYAPSVVGSQSADRVLSNEAPFDDPAVREGFVSGIGAGATIAYGTVRAASKGAGARAAYSGINSAVSSQGLGAVTNLGARLLGTAASGAAATSLCVSAVGGPVVATGLVVVATGALAYTAYKAAESAVSYFGF